MMRCRIAISVLGLGLAMGLGLGGCDNEAGSGESTASASLASGDAQTGPTPAVTSLPQVNLAALQALIRETAEQDRVLVLDFWATWCAPCVALFPDLHAGLKGLGDAVRPVSVTLDSPDDEYEARAIAFLARHSALKDAYLLDPDSDAQIEVVTNMGEQWQDLVVPAILVYDRQGNLAAEFFDGVSAQDIVDKVRTLTGG